MSESVVWPNHSFALAYSLQEYLSFVSTCSSDQTKSQSQVNISFKLASDYDSVLVRHEIHHYFELSKFIIVEKAYAIEFLKGCYHVFRNPGVTTNTWIYRCTLGLSSGNICNKSHNSYNPNCICFLCAIT